MSKNDLSIDRSTFLIDPDGNIARIWRKIKGHVEDVLATFQALTNHA